MHPPFSTTSRAHQRLPPASLQHPVLHHLKYGNSISPHGDYMTQNISSAIETHVICPFRFKVQNMERCRCHRRGLKTKCFNKSQALSCSCVCRSHGHYMVKVTRTVITSEVQVPNRVPMPRRSAVIVYLRDWGIERFCGMRLRDCKIEMFNFVQDEGFLR